MRTTVRFSSRAAVLLLAALAAVAALGCPAWYAAMPIFTRVLSAVADAVPILSEIAQWADRHFGASPDPAKQAKVDAALTRCRKALVAANRAATAASNPADAGAAMAEFKAAWGDLRAALQGLPGVSNLPVATGEPGRLGLVDSKTGETLSVPEPLALTAEAQQ